MAKGVLKYFMLKIISEGKTTGYEIIKKIEEHSGSKPSTGSVYPLLKSMQNEGWIKGIEKDGKTYYEITKSGKNKTKEYDKIKNDYIIKIHESISIANETFHEEGHLLYMDQMEMIHPLIEEIVELQKKGVESEKINKIILKARGDLKKLKS